jgi:hypothetical protein
MMSPFEQCCSAATLSLMFLGAAARNELGAWPLALMLAVFHAIRLLGLMCEADPKERD